MLWQKLKQPPWRTIVPGAAFLALLFVGWWIWTPGADVRDGRHDRGRNGLWLGHGWLGADEWFRENDKIDQMPRFRDPVRIRQLAEKCRAQHITDLFPHLCPAAHTGEIPPVDDAQVQRFLAEFSGARVMPWIGGPAVTRVDQSNPQWRAKFAASATALLARHPGFAGVHLNVEPLTSGDRDFLVLLEELRAALPRGKILSLAAYPPTTIWQRIPAVHWDEPYFREVSRRVDHLAVMMYDTALRAPKLYQRLMADWTQEVLPWSEGKPVLLGVPTYEDAHTEYHRPDVENLRNALLGIHAGLQRNALPANYQGVAIYCEWETDATEWETWRTCFRAKPPGQ
jgi:hypothetical protein